MLSEVRNSSKRNKKKKKRLGFLEGLRIAAGYKVHVRCLIATMGKEKYQVDVKCGDSAWVEREREKKRGRTPL